MVCARAWDRGVEIREPRGLSIGGAARASASSSKADRRAAACAGSRPLMTSARFPRAWARTANA